jgi:hypothetical protein
MRYDSSVWARVARCGNIALIFIPYLRFLLRAALPRSFMLVLDLCRAAPQSLYQHKHTGKSIRQQNYYRV